MSVGFFGGEGRGKEGRRGNFSFVQVRFLFYYTDSVYTMTPGYCPSQAMFTYDTERVMCLCMQVISSQLYLPVNKLKHTSRYTCSTRVDSFFPIFNPVGDFLGYFLPTTCPSKKMNRNVCVYIDIDINTDIYIHLYIDSWTKMKIVVYVPLSTLSWSVTTQLVHRGALEFMLRISTRTKVYDTSKGLLLC